jgi:tetratricopeptide (TPR) repeat protein
MQAALTAVELEPASANAHRALAEASLYKGERRQFWDEAARSMELNPNDAGAIGWFGMVLAFSGRWDEGIALVEKALNFNPSVVSPAARYALAKAHYLRREFPEALEDFEPIWATWPDYWVNDLNRSYLYADWGKQDLAEQAATSLLEDSPDFVIEDAVKFYRKLGFEEAYIDRMVAALEKAGLPHRQAS